MSNISLVKHLVDLDEEALAAARRALGTRTIKDTVNRALAAAAEQSDRSSIISAALSRLAAVPSAADERSQAWR